MSTDKIKKLNSLLDSPYDVKMKMFINTLVNRIQNNTFFKSILEAEKLAEKFDITDRIQVQEAMEVANVQVARYVCHVPKVEDADKYKTLVHIYKNQLNQNARSTKTITLQQYSTPMPIAYLMGLYVGADKPGLFFEPTAGNGMLTIAGQPDQFIVNELDNERLKALYHGGYKKIFSQDALEKFDIPQVDGIIGNPPFGRTSIKMNLDGYEIEGLDHQIMAESLNYLKTHGKAAFILGENVTYDDKGRLKKLSDRVFFNWLSYNYYLQDVINVSGKLYARQGTSWDIKIILVGDTKNEKSKNYQLVSPNQTGPFSPKKIDDFGNLYTRFLSHLK